MAKNKTEIETIVNHWLNTEGFVWDGIKRFEWERELRELLGEGIHPNYSIPNDWIEVIIVGDTEEESLLGSGIITKTGIEWKD